MKINFRKIASVVASTLMIGSTVALAAAANYPAPFVKSGSANVAVVYGSNAVLDLVAVTDITSSLQGQLARQTATTGTSSGATASGGDSVNLATSSQNLFFGSTINSAKTSLTKTELPTLLADNTITDNAGTAYTYSQSITVGGSGVRNITYGTANGNLADPALYLDAGTDVANPLYTYKLTLNKNINVSDSNVIGNDISILGNRYTIGANSVVTGAGSDVVYLYGAGNVVNVNEGDSANVTVGGKSHAVKVTGITQSGSTNVVYVSVDGGSQQKINEGSAANINGVQIYAKTVFYSGKTGSTNYASLNLGTSVLQLSAGQNVFVGTDALSVQNTKVTFGASSGKLSSITLDVAMPDATHSYIPVGGAFTDTVFNGLKIQFADTNPGLNDSSQDMIVVDTDNSRNVRATFNSALGTAPTTFSFLHDQRSDTSSGSPLNNMILADTSNKTIHNVEGEVVGINEYAVINSGDYGRIIKLTNVPTGSLQSTSTIQFTDVVTGQSIFSGSGLTVGTSGNVTTNIDGQPYWFLVTNSTAQSNVSITWGTSASGGQVGTVTTVAPKIKLKNGEWLAFLTQSNLSNGTTYSLPGYDTLTTYESGRQLLLPSGNSGTGFVYSFGNVAYNLTRTASTAALNNTATISGVIVGGTQYSIGGNTTATNGGAVLIQEEKKTTETGNSNDGDVIVVPITTVGSTTVTVGVSQPKVTNITSGLQSWTSNSNRQTSVDRYGSFLTYDSSNNHVVSVNYPVQQMIADVLFTSTGATVTPGSSGSGSVKELGSVAVMDTEVSSVAGKNLIVVGGSCVNSVAANLLGGALCGADFQTKTGVGTGSFLVQTFDRTGGNVATLVAGYDAADTENAAKFLTTQSVDTTVGKKYVGTSSTTASLVTS